MLSAGTVAPRGFAARQQEMGETMRRSIGLAVGGAGLLAAVGLERALERIGSPGAGAVAPVRSTVEIAATPEEAWTVLADLEGQTRWMHDAKAIRVLTPGKVGVGTRAEADVRIFGIGSTDPIEVTAWEPPTRFAIRHLGRFSGTGDIVLVAGDAPGTTQVTWDETLLAPVLPQLAGLLLRPVLRRVFQADLDRFAGLVETGAASSQERS